MIRDTRKSVQKPIDSSLLIIKERAEQLLQGTDHRINLISHRGNAILDVRYTDHSPVRQMRSDLLAIADGKCRVIVSREYSAEFIKSALYDMFVRDTEAIVTCARGGLEAISLRAFVNGMLDERHQL